MKCAEMAHIAGWGGEGGARRGRVGWKNAWESDAQKLHVLKVLQYALRSTYHKMYSRHSKGWYEYVYPVVHRLRRITYLSIESSDLLNPS